MGDASLDDGPADLAGEFTSLAAAAANGEILVGVRGTLDGSEGGPTDGLFTVFQTPASPLPTVITYSVSGTATPGADYAPLTGTVTIPAGETSATIEVVVHRDNLLEVYETVVVTLVSLSGDPQLTLDPEAGGATILIVDNLAFDCGDAPDLLAGGTGYPTRLVDGGPAHRIVSSVLLGSAVDAERDGLPSPQADGDDLDELVNDEDGVVFTTGLVPGDAARLTISASPAGYLNAWIDWNRDGDWDDAGEHVFVDRSLTLGDNALTIDVPSTASLTEGDERAYSRFRFNRVGGLSYGGPANDGEVEDYALRVLDCLTVSTTADSGPGSLRYAIDCANSRPGLQTITFSILGSGPHTIQPLSPLPAVADPVIIDGTTQPGHLGTPQIELDGSLAGADATGLRIVGGGTTVEGLAINRFGVYGIEISEGGGNQVLGNFLGTDPTGTTALGNLNYGISITSSGNRVGGPGPGERNLISGNGRGGVRIAGAAATENVVQGNYVGTDITGALDLGNREAGVAISGMNNLVGGVLEGEENLLSGNDQQGLALFGTGNIAFGNLIGTDASGLGKVANSDYGVVIYASDNQLGGAGEDEGNLISGNRFGGMLIRGETTSGNRVQGNRIGTDPTGMLSVGNTLTGIAVDSSGNTIGGTREEGNLLSGNGREGVSLYQPGNFVMGNLIGTDVTGAGPLGNQGWGVYLVTYDTQVGGSGPGQAGNVVSANAVGGVFLNGADAHDNSFQANIIGLDASGALPLGNGLLGIFVNRSFLNTIGGSGSDGNVISANGREGIWISGGPATNNSILGNRIGTDAAGEQDLGNTTHGVHVTARGNFIGGANPGEGNVISGNGGVGVLLSGATAQVNAVRGNRIGASASGAQRLGNDLAGVAISGNENQVGGELPGEGNLIAWNQTNGITVVGDDALRNAIHRNSIHGNGGLGIDLGPSGRTANDVDDPDTGANLLQNFPVIGSAMLGGGSLVIEYQVPSSPAHARYPLTVEFFLAAAGSGQGEVYLGSHSYTAAGTATATLSVSSLPADSRVVATASDAFGNSSEFSDAAVVGIMLAPAPPFDPPARAEGEAFAAPQTKLLGGNSGLGSGWMSPAIGNWLSQDDLYDVDDSWFDPSGGDAAEADEFPGDDLYADDLAPELWSAPLEK